MRSPKLGGSARRRQYYRYYAGYTLDFVEDVFDRLDVPSTGLVVDPWNGVGTTTFAAAARGLHAQGFDINPAAVVIGRARLVGTDVEGSLVPLATEICERASEHPALLGDGDLLNTWFGPATASELRSLERAICRVLVDARSGETSPNFSDVVPHSALASLFYVALFRTARALVGKYFASNPSWIKHPSGRRVGVSRSLLHSAFVESVKISNPHLGQNELFRSPSESVVTVDLASSTRLPLAGACADAVVSSPPYCTRLDYVKATLPELALMGLTQSDIRRLRDQMIGTPTISGTADERVPYEWGKETRELIHAIAAHSSKASATYYRKYYMQYFAGMWESLNELHRVVKDGGAAVLVVQDSYYKNVHVDLPALVRDMARAAGWTSKGGFDFDVPRTMAAIHPGARQYRREFHAVESAVILQR